MIAELLASEGLVDIEREIVEGLRDRPASTWCPGCFKLLHVIYARVHENE